MRSPERARFFHGFTCWPGCEAGCEGGANSRMLNMAPLPPSPAEIWLLDAGSKAMISSQALNAETLWNLTFALRRPSCIERSHIACPAAAHGCGASPDGESGPGPTGGIDLPLKVIRPSWKVNSPRSGIQLRFMGRLTSLHLPSIDARLRLSSRTAQV